MSEMGQFPSAQVRAEGAGDLGHGVERHPSMPAVDRGRQGDYHRDHDPLGHDTSDRGVVALLVQVGGSEALVDDGSLLVEDHPGHDDRTNVGGQQRQVGRVPQGQVAEASEDLVDTGVAEQHGRHEGQLGQADGYTDALDPAVTAAESEADQKGRGHGHSEPFGQPEQFTNPGDSGELGQQRAHGRQHEGGCRQRCPPRPKMLAYELAMALTGDHSEAHGHFLGHVQDGDEHQLGQYQCVAPLGPGLSRGNNATGIGVGQHDDQARAPHGQQPQHQPTAPGDRPLTVDLRRGAGRPGGDDGG
jgi:hypothetical protein